jgi:hypothetical protein
VEEASFSRIRRPRWYANQSSERASPFGSTALKCHWSRRCVFVNEPSFSTCAAAGRRKISVRQSSALISPVSTSGESNQNVADSIS